MSCNQRNDVWIIKSSLNFTTLVWIHVFINSVKNGLSLNSSSVKVNYFTNIPKLYACIFYSSFSHLRELYGRDTIQTRMLQQKCVEVDISLTFVRLDCNGPPKFLVLMFTCVVSKREIIYIHYRSVNSLDDSVYSCHYCSKGAKDREDRQRNWVKCIKPQWENGTYLINAEMK